MTGMTVTELAHIVGGVDLTDLFRTPTLEDLILVCGRKAPEGAAD